MTKNYYEILRVSPNATSEEIKKAYRVILKEIHPDLNPDNKESEEKTKKVNEAYEVLSDATKRKKYDQSIITAQRTSTRQTYSRSTSGSASPFNSTTQTTSTRSTDGGFGPFSYSTFFNGSSKKINLDDIIKENEEAYDKFIAFLTKIEEEFKQFNLTTDSVRKEIEGKRGKITSYELDGMKSSLEHQLEEIKANAQYYDELIAFLAEIDVELKQNNINLTTNSVRKEIAGKRGKISKKELTKIKSDLKSELEEAKSKTTAYDEFLTFLSKIDIELKQNNINLTTNSVRKNIEGKRGVITKRELSDLESNLKKQLEEIKRNAKYYDEFLEFYKSVKSKIDKSGEKFNLEELEKYIDPKNKGQQPKEFYKEAEDKLNELNIQLTKLLSQRFNSLHEEMQKLEIIYYINNFMQKKGISLSSNLSFDDLKEIEEYKNTYVETQRNLKALGINFDVILKKLKRSQQSLSLEELRIILRNTEEMKQKDLLSKWKLNNNIVSEINEHNAPKM